MYEMVIMYVAINAQDGHQICHITSYVIKVLYVTIEIHVIVQ